MQKTGSKKRERTLEREQLCNKHSEMIKNIYFFWNLRGTMKNFLPPIEGCWPDNKAGGKEKMSKQEINFQFLPL